MLYGCVPALWHLSVALSVGLWLWGLCAVALVLALELAARACVEADDGALHALAQHAWLCARLSAFFIALSHTPEPRLPPRAVQQPSARA